MNRWRNHVGITQTTAAVTLIVVVLGALDRSAAAATFVKGVVPDWNQPYWHGINGPNGGPAGGPFGPWRFWCTPTSAANVIGYWEDQRGHDSSDGAVAPASGVAWPNWPAYQDYMANGSPMRGAVPPGMADDIAWYIDTNRRGDPLQGNPGGAMNHVGTFAKDISRPNLGLNKFFVARGLGGYRARTQGSGYADPGLPMLNAAQAWTQITKEIDADRPVMVGFMHWLVTDLQISRSDTSPEGSWGWSYFDIVRGPNPGQPDPWGNGEEWGSQTNQFATGHVVTVVGYIPAGSPDDIGPTLNPPWPPTNWVIAHDNVGPTPRNVAVPFVAPPWLYVTVIRCRGEGPIRFETVEIVDDTADVGRHVSLALDSDDVPHVAYADWTNQDVRYAKKPAGDWTRQVVRADHGVVTGVSLVVTEAGSPRIAYTAGSDFNQPKDLYYAYEAGGWFRETVYSTTLAAVATDPAIALKDGYPRIVSRRGLSEVRLSWKDVAGGGGLWNHNVIDANASCIGGACANAVAVDTTGAVHIAYSDFVQSGVFNVQRLKYATNECTGSWNVNVVESFAGSTNYSVGQFPSVGLGRDNRRTISHYALSEQDLRVAALAGGCGLRIWSRGAIDNNIAQGSTCVRYNSLDRAVIAYWGACPGPTQPYACLKIARSTAAGWQSQTVFDPAQSGIPNQIPYLSMDVDDADLPHVAFYGPEVSVLRYVRAYRIGDVDGDGCVDQNDRGLLVSVLLDPAAATPEQRRAADCNGDGALNGEDIQCLVELLLS